MDNKKRSMYIQPPLSNEQKERIAKKILAGADSKADEPELSKNRPITIRIPDAYHRDIEKIHRITGLTKNGVCIELFRVAIRLKLKELEESQ